MKIWRQHPDNVDQMATEAEQFIDAMGFDKIDLLGFSLGGFAAQSCAVRKPCQVQKMILAGSAPQGGEEHLLKVLAEAGSHKKAPSADRA